MVELYGIELICDILEVLDILETRPSELFLERVGPTCQIILNEDHFIFFRRIFRVSNSCTRVLS